MRNAFRSWMLVVGVCLAAVTIGCGDDDNDGPADSGTPDAGKPDAGKPDSGTDSGTPDGGGDSGTPDSGTPDSGMPDSGTDGGSDAGTDGGTDAGSVAYVRFVNASLGLKNNPSDNESAAWAPYKLDVYRAGTEVFDSVAPGENAVTDYVAVPANMELEFETRNAEAATGAALATSAKVTLQTGARLTLVAVGFADRTDPNSISRAQLLALNEGFGIPASGTAQVRFVAADRVLTVPTDGRTRRLALESSSASPVSTVNTYSAAEAAGVAIPTGTQRLVISTSGDTGFVPAVSKRLFFSVPSATLTEGSAWFAILTGDDRRPLPDEGQPALLLVRAGQKQVVRVARDPLVYFFNALLPVNADADPPVLQAFLGASKVAVKLEFNFFDSIGDLPVSAAGHSLKFTRNDDANAVILEGAQTGPLRAGRRYLAVIAGRTGQTGTQAPRFVVAEDTLSTGPATPRVRVLNASSNAPVGGLDFGFTSLPSGSDICGTTFTPSVSGVVYGELSGPSEGASFVAPVNSTTSLSTYAVRATGTNEVLCTQGSELQRPHFIVLLGDWETGLRLFLGFNVFDNTWSGASPFDVFQ